MKASVLKPVLYAIVQALSIIFLLITQRWFSFNQWLLIPSAAGGIIALWAIGEMRQSRLNILPDLLPGASLITSGPYRYVRHPMYTSLVVIFVPFVLVDFTFFRLSALLLLIGSLLLKITREERQLLATFPEYLAYTKRTQRLIPLLY